MTEIPPPAGPDAPIPDKTPPADLPRLESAKPDLAKPDSPAPTMKPAKVDLPKPPVSEPTKITHSTATLSTAKPPAATSPTAASPPLPPKPPVTPAAALRTEPTGSSRSALAVFCAVGFLLLVGGGFYLWQQIQALEHDDSAPQVAQLESQIRSLREQVAQLAQRPLPTPPPPVDLKPIDQQVAALGQRLTALEQRPVPQAPAPVDLTALTAQITALQARVGQAETRATQVSDSAAKSARLQAAGAALSFGQPVGVIPGAPPALAKFATASPPTDQSLRAGFDAAARAAEADSQPPAPTGNFADRMLARMSAVVTVRHGDDVVMGAPAAKILGDARGKLQAGDLAGAVSALDALDPAAAQAMAAWRAQAQSLLEARAALASLAHS